MRGKGDREERNMLRGREREIERERESATPSDFILDSTADIVYMDADSSIIIISITIIIIITPPT